MSARLFGVAAVALAACQTSLDLQKGRGFQCARDAGLSDADQCGNGFRCGLEGYCHAVGAAGPYVCQTASDCESQWVCGLEGTCHAPGDVQAWRCVNDTQCAGGWRCGLEGRCLDPSADALGPSDSPAGAMTVWAPKMLVQGPAGGQSAVQSNGLFFFQEGPDVFHFNVSSDELYRVSPAPAEPFVGVITIAGATVILDGGLGFYDEVPDSGLVVAVDVHGNPIGNVRLRSDPGLGIVALGELSDGGASLRHFYNASTPLHDPVAAPATPLFDAVLLRSNALPGACLFAASRNGLDVSGDDGMTWNPVTGGDELLNPSCPGEVIMGAYTRLELKVQQDSPRRLAVISQFDNEPAPSVQLIDAERYLASDAGACPYSTQGFLGCRGALPSAIWPRCVPCDEPGETLEEMSIVRGQDAIVARCENGPVGRRMLLVTGSLGNGICNATEFSPPSSVVRDSFASDPRARSMSSWGAAGAHGQLWFGQSPADVMPVFLDRAADGLVFDGPDASVTAVAGGLRATFGPRGAVAASTPLEEVSLVDGDDELIVLANGVVIRRGEPVAVIDAAPGAFKPPVHAVAGTAVDGGRALLVSAFDTLYVGTLPEPGQISALELRAVPSPGAALISIAATDESGRDAGLWMGGWALTRNGLSRLTATGPSRWRATDVTVPDGELLETWTDGNRSRLGYSDGTIVSLPSRVVIAPPLGDAIVYDYLAACGQTYALTQLGLFRLAPTDAGVGAWTPEELTAASPWTFAPEALSGGRLAFFDHEIWVFTQFGGVLSFAPQAGCP